MCICVQMHLFILCEALFTSLVVGLFFFSLFVFIIIIIWLLLIEFVVINSIYFYGTNSAPKRFDRL